MDDKRRGDVLREYRRAAKVSQGALQEHLGWGEKTVFWLEKNSPEPSEDQLHAAILALREITEDRHARLVTNL